MTVRTLASVSSLEGLKKEAKRWLKALRANDSSTPDAFDRLRAAVPTPPADPGLRDVQHALAREFGFAGWIALSNALIEREDAETAVPADPLLTELLDASVNGQLNRVRASLDAHPALINERGKLDRHIGLRTALHFAVAAESEPVVRLLLDRGADPNIRDEGDNAIPLHFAAEKGLLPIVKLLIEHGSDPIGAGTMHELEILGWATCFGAADPAVVEYLLAHGARHDICSAVATDDVNAIRAVVAANPAALRYTMDAANNKRRPLHLAVVKKKIAAFTTLLELGADIELMDASGMTALDQAALAGDQTMVELLVARGGAIQLPTAIALQREDDAQRLLRDNPGALAPGGKWDKLIIHASEHSPRRVIEGLLRAGASPNIAYDDENSIDTTPGYTPLHAAAINGNADAVDVLLNHGASVTARDGRYCGTPAGWADFRGHTDIRDFILQRDIDLFQAIDFGLNGRILEILRLDPGAFDRPFRGYTDFDTELVDDRPDPATTPLEWAELTGRDEAARILRSYRDSGPADESTTRIARFLRNACLDWRIDGSARLFRRDDATRVLQEHPELAGENIFTSVVCGDMETVRRFLAGDRSLATERGGPRNWPPILYLCDARLASAQSSDNAPAIARLLFEHGADPNSYYLGGNPTIHYTAFTCVMGMGEEQALVHANAQALMAVLFEHGAEPYDTQVMYNVFANHASRNRLEDDIVWMLQAMYDRSIQLGRSADWTDGSWKMLDMGGYGPGAPFVMKAAGERQLRRLVQWLVEHGAGGLSLSNALVAEDPLLGAIMRLDRVSVARQFSQRPELKSEARILFQAVERRRLPEVELLLDLGMSPDVAGKMGRRALHVAAFVGAVDIAQLLIDRGADYDYREGDYQSIPLGVASWARQPALIELFGKYSRDIWELVYTGRVERLRELIREDPSLARTKGSEGDIPLMWLPTNDRAALEITKLFLANGADAAARNKDDKSAADIARERGMVDVAALLEGRAL